MAVDPEQIKAALKVAFDKVDTDEDGKISKSDLKTCLQEAGFEGDEDNVQAIIERADLSGDGLLDFEEFARAVIAVGIAVRVVMFLKRLFAELDTDDTGFISPDNIKELVARAGVAEKISDEDIDTLIAEVDSNGDGQISFDEFLAKIRSVIQERLEDE